ncbi:amidohydrolase/deacetylase family metallohydrolase [Gracilibacillus alcaliphilus]|uniref:amidohydrolase/deacetylase family metallohydrolase n=1 Tax=Gracilibacillus alcaliphilus TaxID=1401441 RepID=UPI00195EBFBD|nr:amidohydrolase/deacetylase family metallohydrolase [Gracilibacillus alcaliphilus]MBM7675506.1 dihydroorotase [Gracilibacillus alcaliphilus]
MTTSYVLQNLQFVTGELVDIVVKNGQIEQIATAGQGQAQQKYDYSGCYVSSGWIDLHVHANNRLHPYGDDIDEIGVRQGVTTIVDAGSCGADNVSDILPVAATFKTDLLAFLNISTIGLQRIDELSNLEWLDKQALLDTIKVHCDKIVGLKVRMSQSVVKDSGLKPLETARQFADETKLPLMVHIGSGPPDINSILQLLDQGDIITHFLNGKANNLFDLHGKPLPSLLAAIQRGVLLDVGHGSASFSFKVAEEAKRHGIAPFSISSDIYRDNRKNGPVYSLAHVASKFLLLGYSLEQIIDAVTVQPAKAIHQPELGQLKAGRPADLTLFEVVAAKQTLTDSDGETRTAKQMINTIGVVKNGELIT